jgi:hypothetical protein
MWTSLLFLQLLELLLELLLPIKLQLQLSLLLLELLTLQLPLTLEVQLLLKLLLLKLLLLKLLMLLLTVERHQGGHAPAVVQCGDGVVRPVERDAGVERVAALQGQQRLRADPEELAHHARVSWKTHLILASRMQT